MFRGETTEKFLESRAKDINFHGNNYCLLYDEKSRGGSGAEPQTPGQQAADFLGYTLRGRALERKIAIIPLRHDKKKIEFSNLYISKYAC